jgi:hypothetical protein
VRERLAPPLAAVHRECQARYGDLTRLVEPGQFGTDRVGRGNEPALDEDRSAARHDERRHDLNPRCLIEGHAAEHDLVPAVIASGGTHAAVGERGIRRQAGRGEIEHGLGSRGECRRVGRAPLMKPMELPDAEADAEERDDDEDGG